MKRIFFLMMLLWSACRYSGVAQIKDGPYCENKWFDKMVRQTVKGTVPTLDVSELKKRYSEFQILDAREKEEFNVSHLKNAQFLGYKEMNEEALQKLDKNKPVAIYCSIGYRSEKMTEKLQEMGFKDIYNIYGSIFEWVNRGYPVVDSSGKETNKVHGYSRTWGIWVKNEKAEVVYK
jgi:rhodanese-related sulfurtransferase